MFSGEMKAKEERHLQKLVLWIKLSPLTDQQITFHFPFVTDHVTSVNYSGEY